MRNLKTSKMSKTSKTSKTSKIRKISNSPLESCCLKPRSFFDGDGIDGHVGQDGDII